MAVHIPVARTLNALDGVVFAEFTTFHVPQYGIQLVELPLAHVHLAQKGARKGTQRLRSLYQPVQHRVRIDLEHPRGGPHAQALGQARQHADEQLHGSPFAMQNRALGLEKIAFAGETLELTPRATAGMAVGAQIA
jgi:hypothetical protein